MSLRIRRLLMAVTTAQGRFGATIPFEDGLNVLWAPNTSGKSTAIMSILYALGLEGMLGPSHQPPLPDAMRTHIMTGTSEIPVVESFVRMEIENGDGQRITVQRQVESSNPKDSRQLVRTWIGPYMTNPDGEYERRDFYVRTSGAATDPSGFHRFLAEFIGYKLPQIPAADNETVPLYLECIFPYFFVDQMTGWRDIKARMPTYLRIMEMGKRSAEYVLSLDILRRSIDKQEYERKQTQLKEKWTTTARKAKAVTVASHVIVRGIPDDPTATWPPTPPPELLITDGTTWKSLRESIKSLQTRLKEIDEKEIPRAEQVAQSAIEDLQLTEEELSRLTSRLESLTRDLMAERAHRDSVFKRLQALAEDYRKYQDAKKVEDRGGNVPIELASGNCPTCHQPIKDVLLEQEHASPPMTLEENILFIRDQMATFRDMHEDANGVVEAKERQLTAIRQKISDVNTTVRSLKQTLHSGGEVPSTAAIQERLLLEQSAVSLQEVTEEFADFDTAFENLSQEWAEIQTRLKSLTNIGLTDMDDKKIAYLQTMFAQQLEEYQFSSFPIDQMSISRGSYRPSRNDYDVGLTSASDTIRIIWAYLIGMLETDRKFQTNHLGMLVFDEPRQQGTKTLSFDALLKRASKCADSKQQVIVATSEEKETLDTILKSVPCHYLQYTGKMLTLIVPKKKT
ncbi:MAG: AAA family ATPase [Planctomycetaceae bacterium]|nr:AAA family ATPase [Planctomycetaceae bacterium]